MNKSFSTEQAARVEPLPEPDIYEVCRNFILEFALPRLAPEEVFQDRQEDEVPPEANGDYAMLSLRSSERHGTGLARFTENANFRQLYKIGMRLDFCGASEASRVRAQRAVLAACSEIGVAFFSNQGFSPLYAEEMPASGLSDQNGSFVQRCRVILYFSRWSEIDLAYEYFDKVQLARLENIDVRHPVKA